MDDPTAGTVSAGAPTTSAASKYSSGTVPCSCGRHMTWTCDCGSHGLRASAHDTLRGCLTVPPRCGNAFVLDWGERGPGDEPHPRSVPHWSGAFGRTLLWRTCRANHRTRGLSTPPSGRGRLTGPGLRQRGTSPGPCTGGEGFPCGCRAAACSAQRQVSKFGERRPGGTPDPRSFGRCQRPTGKE
jgi:hypothetical protein